MNSPIADQPTDWNWGKTYRFRASKVLRPTTVDELLSNIRSNVAEGVTVRCVGSRHSFTGIADADVLLDLSAMPERFDVVPDRQSIVVHGAMTYARLAELLQPLDLAVANLASLPHLTIAGATATGTHGSGDRNGNLATSIHALEVATSTGELRRITRDHADFAATPISIGALGAVVSVELAVEPAFQVEQKVHTEVSLSRVIDSFDDLFASAYSVSVFTDWLTRSDLWTKQRMDESPPAHAELHAGILATEALHPVPGEDASACTNQSAPGPWSQRLPHFRSDAVPSVGAEVQSEFFVDRAHGPDVIRALQALGPQIEPILMTSEIRTVRGDDLWLSAQYERDRCAFHFTWHHDVPAAFEATRWIVDALAPFEPVPHWGKVFDPNQFDLPRLFPRMHEAFAVFAQWDPIGAFTNHWMQETIHKQS